MGTLVRECHLVGAKKGKEHGELRATPSGIEYTGPSHTVIEWSAIKGVTVDVEIERRVTVGRVATIGVFALAAKKKVETTTIAIDAGFASAAFETDQPLPEVQRAFAPLVGRLESAQRKTALTPTSPTAQPPSAANIADELTKLAALRDSGVLSTEEFDAQKAKLLG